MVVDSTYRRYQYLLTKKKSCP